VLHASGCFVSVVAGTLAAAREFRSLFGKVQFGGAAVTSAAADADGAGVLSSLKRRLHDEGLNIVLPVDPAALTQIGAAHSEPPGAWERGAVVVGDGGPTFFSRYQRAKASGRLTENPAAASDPLDAYTRRVVQAAVADVVAACGSQDTLDVWFPFGGDGAGLSFQRLGEAAGLPPPGPIGLQIHPIYGPWWAYRALILGPITAFASSVAVPSSCTDCSRPCVSACPAHAVLPEGFRVHPCAAHRLADPACQESCVARIACPIGAAHRYSEQQLAFHMRASLTMIRRLQLGGT
jgi:hypothetical protein